MAVRTIDWIRHGQYDHETGLLTPLGVEQIEHLAERYKRDGTVTKLWMSPVPRATQSGQIVAEVLCMPVRTRKNLYEGIPTMKSPVPRYLADFPLEKVEESRLRLDRELESLVKVARGSDKHVVLICHGNVTRYHWCLALGLPPMGWWDLAIHNGGLTRIRVHRKGTVKGVHFNDVGHLPPNMLTEK